VLRSGWLDGVTTVRPDVLVQMNNRMSQWQFRNRPTLTPSRAALAYARVIGIVVFAVATFAFVTTVRGGSF
jgi:hypothetical protein